MKSPEKAFCKVFPVLFLLSFFHPGFSQTVKFEHLTRKDGLSSNSVTSIVQDKQGFMWFGTKNGLVRYDGYTCRSWYHDKEDTLSLGNNIIRCLEVAQDGKIYIGFNFSGFCIFDPQTETFTRYRHTPGKNSLSDDNVLCIEEDNSGNIWIGTWSGLDLFKPGTGLFQHFDVPRQMNELGPVSNYVSSIFPDSSGNLWLYTQGNKIAHLNPASGSFTYLRFSENPLDKQLLNCGGIVYCDSRGNIWIGTEYEGLYRYDISGRKSFRYSVENDELGSNIVMDILEDRDGQIWVATDGGGLALYDQKKDTFRSFTYDPHDRRSISTNAVYTLYESHQGIIWTGNFVGGVNIFKKDKNRFRIYTDIGPSGFRMTNKAAISFAEAPDGKVWIGTNGGGLELFDPENESFRNYDIANGGSCFNIVRTLYKDRKGNLWMGSYGAGACRKSKDSLFHITDMPDASSLHLTRPSVWAITEDRKGHIWMGLLENGLDIYDPVTKTIRHIAGGGKEGLPSGSIHVLFKDSRERIWVGSETHGLALYDESSDRFRVFNSENSTGLISNNVKTIAGGGGKIWVGLENGGLCVLRDEEENLFVSYTRTKGFPANSVYGILEDDRNNLWLGSDNGILVFNMKTGKCRNFTTDDGLPTNEFIYGAVFKDRQGFLYFGTNQGLIRFHPASFLERKPEIPVYITSVKLFNKEIGLRQDNAGKYLKAPIQFAGDLYLTHQDYMVTLDFAALDYSSPAKNQYAYMLEGFDGDWVYTDAGKRSATYTNLPPGTYTFRVKASGNSENWVENRPPLRLHVKPPWWDTWLFKSLTVFLLASVVVGGFLIKIEFVQRQRKKLEQLVAIRTSELELKNEQLNASNATKDKLFSIISHDLKGPIKSIQALAKLVVNNGDRFNEADKKEALERLLKSSTAVSSLVTDLFNWARLHTDHLDPVKTDVSVNNLLETVVDIAELQAREKNVSILWERGEEIFVKADITMLETIIRNLVNNAIKFTPSGGHITFSSSVKNNNVSICISDSGIGMDKSILRNLFRGNISRRGTGGEAGFGLGLMICKDFASALGARMTVDSEVGAGTTFEIILPLLKKRGIKPVPEKND